MLIEWVFRGIIIPNFYNKSKLKENQFKFIYVERKKIFTNLKSKNKNRNVSVHLIVKIKNTVIEKKYKHCQQHETIENLNLLYTKVFNLYNYCNTNNWIKKLKCQSNVSQTDLNKRLFFYIKTKKFKLKTIIENLFNVNMNFFCKEKQCKFFFFRINRNLITSILERLVLETFEAKKKFGSNFFFKNQYNVQNNTDNFSKFTVRNRLLLLKSLKNNSRFNQKCCLINKRYWFSKKIKYYKYKIYIYN
jgi:hypothetical protein